MPILYSPIPISSQDGHGHATLIATSATPNKKFSVPTVKNWRELVQHVGKNTSLAFDNVQTANPCSCKTTLTTKFRLFENEAAYVELFFAQTVLYRTKPIYLFFFPEDDFNSNTIDMLQPQSLRIMLFLRLPSMPRLFLCLTSPGVVLPNSF